METDKKELSETKKPKANYVAFVAIGVTFIGAGISLGVQLILVYMV